MKSKLVNNTIIICVVTLYFAAIVLAQISKSYSSCWPPNQCNKSECVTPNDCVHAITVDECDCCQVCVRDVGQTCGKRIGKCATGLSCIKKQFLQPVMTNSVISGKENGIGICGILNCTGVKCRSDNITCPIDSYKLSSHTSNECCALSCACLPGICNSSQRCARNKIARVLKPGNWSPGSCCDSIECIDAPSQCIHNNEKYVNGDKWYPDKCTTCVCKDGLTFCHVKQCNITDSCNAMIALDGECCPTCQGCVSSNGLLYNNSQKWVEDDCTHCQCENGKISCTVELCRSLNCDNQVTVSGRCCPVCQTYVCNLFCPFGYKKDYSGKEICECNKCANINDCSKECRYGYMRNEYGCETCECLNSNYDLANINKGVACILSNGTIYENGHIWLENKCHHCFCNNGKIVCTSPQCTKLNCYHQVIHQNQCCPSCDVQQSNNIQNNGMIQTNLFIIGIVITLIIALLLLGIFVLLAFALFKKFNYKNRNEEICHHSINEKTIFQLWSNDQNPVQKYK